MRSLSSRKCCTKIAPPGSGGLARRLLYAAGMRNHWALLAFLSQAAACGQVEWSATGGDAGSDASDPAAAARAQFTAEVEPILRDFCAACHTTDGGTGPAFLKAPMYETIKAWPNNLVVPGQPNDSRLYTYGTNANHTGPEFTADQADVVRRWILIEVPTGGGGDQDAGVQTSAFDVNVGGDNTVDLAPLGTGLDGAKLTFKATALSAGLFISDLKISAGPGGVHFVHPLFMTWCPDPKPDPVDSFYGLDYTVNPNTVGMVGGGTVALTDFSASKGCKLSIHFKKIEPGMTSGGENDGGVTGGCKDVPSFTANAQPPLTQRCATAACHAGGGTARNAWDLTQVPNAGDPTAQAAGCAQARSKINLGDPPNSIMFQRVAPGQATGHPLTLNNTDFTAFRNAILAWVANEQ